MLVKCLVKYILAINWDFKVVNERWLGAKNIEICTKNIEIRVEISWMNKVLSSNKKKGQLKTATDREEDIPYIKCLVKYIIALNWD